MITVEEHNVIGGLCGAVTEVLAEEGMGAKRLAQMLLSAAKEPVGINVVFAGD